MRNEQHGMVIPFGMTPVRMRKSAAECRRRRETLESLILLRRAAEQDDATAGWLQTAQEMRHLGCWEGAAEILARVLSRTDRPPAAWLEMALCMQRLGRERLMESCLYHLLQEDPWSKEGDAARSMLAQRQDDDRKQPGRVERLQNRSARAWRGGDMPLCERRLRRVTRIAAHKEHALMTLARLQVQKRDLPRALAYCLRARRVAGDTPDVLCWTANVLLMMGRPRMAAGFLRLAMPMCTDVQQETLFIASARAAGARQLIDQYLDNRLKQLPKRPALLYEKGVQLWTEGRHNEAQYCWHTALSVYPGDLRSSALLEWTQRYPERKPLPLMRMPRSILAQHQELLQHADAAEVLRHGSMERRAMEWYAASDRHAEQMLVLETAMRHPDRAAEAAFLKELLCRPDTAEPLRQMAMARLAETAAFDEQLVLTGEQYSLACRRSETETARKPGWHTFLPLLLTETACYGQGADVARTAAQLWREMPHCQRRDAAEKNSYLWCKAMELYWLRSQGRDDEALQVVRGLAVSMRRVGCVLRRLARNMEKTPEVSGEGDTTL